MSTHYSATSHYAPLPNITLHYLHYPGKGSPVLALHGLTANAYNYEGLIQAGLGAYEVIIPDMRGRGLSDKPAFGYGLDEHAEDIIALLDYLKLQQVQVIGHSFGGFLAIYLAHHFPERISKIVLLDAAIKMNHRTAEMLGASLTRLDTNFENWDTYLQTIQSAVYMNAWHPEMESYYRADIATASDGSVEPRVNLGNIIQVSADMGQQDWEEIFSSINQETLLVQANGVYALEMPLLYEDDARDTVALMKQATFLMVPGNHVTLMYGEDARIIMQEVMKFFAGSD